MRWKRTAAAACLTLIGIVCVLYLGIWGVVQTPQFQSWVENRARRAGVDLTLGGISLSFPFNLVVSSVNASSAGSFDFSSEIVRADLNPFTLLFGELSELSLVGPRLRIPVPQASEGGAGAPIALVVRSLNIHDGRVELDIGGDEAITIPHIDLTGHDLNLGSQSGEIATAASIPELDAVLDVRLAAAPSAIKATFEMTQPRSRGTTPDAGEPAQGKSSGELLLEFRSDTNLRFSGKTDLDRFALDSITATGRFALDADLDTRKGTATVDFQAETTHLAGAGLPADPSPLLPASVRMKGEYDIENKRLTFSDVRINMPVETLTGSGSLSLDQEPTVSAVVAIPAIALPRLKSLMPPHQASIFEDLDGQLSGRLSIKGKFNPWSFAGSLDATANQVKLAGARIQHLESTIPFTLQTGSLEASELQFTARQVAWRPPGQKLDVSVATFVTHGALQYAPGGTQRFEGRLEVSGGRFATDDGLTAAEGIKTSASLRVERRVGNLLHGRLQARLETMEFLWQRFFADFKAERPELLVSATYDPATQRLDIGSGRLGFDTIGTIAISGGVDAGGKAPGFDVHVSAADLRLANFYDFFLRETFNTSHPLIGALQLTGTASANLVSRGGTQQFSVEGTAKLTGMVVGHPDGWRIGPVDGTLPFRMEYPQGTPRETGKPVPPAGIAVRSIRFGQSEVPPFTIFLSLWDNALTLTRPLQIPLYGGAFVIERLAWRDVVAAPRKFFFSGRIDDISLAPMTRDLGWYQFNGNLSGRIPEVSWADDTFRTDGRLEVRVFDGQVRIDNLEVSSLAGALPRIKVDVEIRDIDLERATKAFEFGTISGTLAGTVDGLVLSNGQPSQFRADVHTVPTSGVSQWISVEALNKLVVLGSGSEASAPYGLLAGFFDFYRYRKIGFKAQLRNDLLILHGIKSEEGKEFLVEGSLIPPTVNVVSHMQRISFKELVSRLERIGEIGPSTSTPPP